MTAMIVARIFAVCSWIATFSLLYASTYLNPPSASREWIQAVMLLLSLLAMLPNARSLNLKKRMSSIVYCIIKSGGSFACFYGFNQMASSINIQEDVLLIRASLAVGVYLLAIDFLYDVDEVFGVSDGYLFGGYGAMLGQKLIPEWIVVSTCVAFYCIKNGLKLYKESGAKQEEGQKQKLEQKGKGYVFIVARIFAVCSWIVTFCLVYASTYLNPPPASREWIQAVVLVLSFLAMLPEARSLNLKKRLNAILYCFIKSGGSFACYYGFNQMSSSINIQEDVVLMNASLSFAIYLLCIDFLYELDEDIEVCDGYLFAGYGSMLGQKHIAEWIVIVTGVLLCLVKNIQQTYRKREQNGGDTYCEVEMGKVRGEVGGVEATQNADAAIQVKRSELLRPVSFRRNRGV